MLLFVRWEVVPVLVVVLFVCVVSRRKCPVVPVSRIAVAAAHVCGGVVYAVTLLLLLLLSTLPPTPPVCHLGFPNVLPPMVFSRVASGLCPSLGDLQVCPVCPGATKKPCA